MSRFIISNITDMYKFLMLHLTFSQGGLIISDSLNHNSIVNGARGSGASIRVFKHNSKFVHVDSFHLGCFIKNAL